MRAVFLIAAMLGPKVFRNFVLFFVIGAVFLFYCISR
jgi:hypothetical protein